MHDCWTMRVRSRCAEKSDELCALGRCGWCSPIRLFVQTSVTSIQDGPPEDCLKRALQFHTARGGRACVVSIAKGLELWLNVNFVGTTMTRALRCWQTE